MTRAVRNSKWKRRAKRKLFGARRRPKRCALCGQFMRWGEATLDHIIPQSKGGSEGIRNLQAVHKSCNQKKGST